MMAGTVKDHHLVLRRAPEELILASLRHTLNQHLVRLAHILSVAFSREFILQGNHLIESSYLDLLGNIVL